VLTTHMGGFATSPEGEHYSRRVEIVLSAFNRA